ncbi:MAG: LacI family DNA-binding transcriptional regulator [Lachnospiraceae bacterium]|nr:LacI family DNA-binding transcriptional regulator [Lachnospiraceae bacterium]
MAVTITDIAKEAGVSISTVSRVMNNTKPVSPELRDRVYAIIDKHHFSPNILAQSLITKKTNIVGVIVPDISNAVFGALTKGINSVCTDKGFTIMVCESGGKTESEIKLLNILEERHIDGVLFAGVDVNTELVQEMQKKSYPVVLVTQEASSKESHITTVIHDNVQAVYDVVQFLHENGHERIAYIGGLANDFSSGKKRLDGYKKAMRDLGLKINDSYIEQREFSLDGGYEGMKKIYEESSRLPSAVVAGSDLIAIGAIKFLSSKHVSVPADISIVGFDDLDYAVYIRPELTTVRIPYFEEGQKAAEALLKSIEGQETEPAIEYIPHKIIRRETVKSI